LGDAKNDGSKAKPLSHPPRVVELGLKAKGKMTCPRPAELRDNPIAIANFLTRALRTNDLELVVAALGAVIRAQNVLAVAEAAGLRREGLYRTFSGDGDPRIGRLLKLFAALDVQLVVRALPQTPKPARPKLGRPFPTKPGLKTKR
jgi:probable addiction module antidote protein